MNDHLSPGDRVELVYTNDQHTPLKPGIHGTVTRCDDAGTLHVKWDDGSTLGLIAGEDQWRPVRRCPRCTFKMSLHPALSRTDNCTDICSECGTLEALEVFAGMLMPQEEWAEHLLQYLAPASRHTGHCIDDEGKVECICGLDDAYEAVREYQTTMLEMVNEAMRKEKT
jgi:hypothetical protein